MSKKTVLCLFGGKSAEYEVSLMSAANVISALNRDRYQIVTVGITRDGRWYLYTGTTEDIRNNHWCSDTSTLHRAFLSPSGDRLLYTESDIPGSFETCRIDVVIPVMHGANAEDGTMQGYLTIADIPYVGPHCAASAIAMDKAFTALVLQNFGIPMVPFTVVTKRELQEDENAVIRRAEEVSDYPLFVKPANAGSSVGAGRADNQKELIAAIKSAAQYDRKILVQKCVTAREIECAVLGNENPDASVPGEIDSGAVFYDYDAKYVTDTSTAYIPARIRPETAEKIRSLAKQVYTALDCRGLSRADFFVTTDADGAETVYFNEINTLPGFTNISMYPKLRNYMGQSSPELLDALITLAEEEHKAEGERTL